MIRQTKAREVFLLFRRTEILNKQIKKQEKKSTKNKNSVSNNQRIDVTGLDNGWYIWLILFTPFISMILNNQII